MLMNFKMATIVGILTFMSMISFMLRGVEHEKSFITSAPDLDPKHLPVILLLEEFLKRFVLEKKSR